MAELSRLPEDKVLETTCYGWEGEESQAGRVWLWQHQHPTDTMERKCIILFSKTRTKAGPGLGR